MPGSSSDLKRQPKGLPSLITKAFESIGLLNKGSAALSQGSVSETEAGEKAPVVSTSLNVTRVGGTSALITGAGGAFLALLQLDDQTPAIASAAAYAGAAVVVAAALVATAIIIVADVRARSAVTLAELTEPETSASQITSDDALGSFRVAWVQVLERLQNVKAKLPSALNRADVTRLWLEAEATKGLSGSLEPPPNLGDEDQLLRTGQEEVCELLRRLRADPNMSTERDDLRLIIDHLQTVLNNVPSAA